MSSWKIQCIIKASGLYYDPGKQARTNRKRSITKTKKKITELKRKPMSGFLLCLDTVVKYWNGKKRYILTAIDHYWSRVKTPKDNPVNERFNRTLQEEFLDLGNMTADTVEFNRRLTEWLIEYNFHRPHQTLGYLPPINFTFKYHKVLPMYPSNTPN